MLSILKYLLDNKPLTKIENIKIDEFYDFYLSYFDMEGYDDVIEYIHHLSRKKVFEILCDVFGRNNIKNNNVKDICWIINHKPSLTVYCKSSQNTIWKTI